MSKETLDMLNELSKKPTTELAMSYMEVVADNMTKDKEIERLNNIINEFDIWLKSEIEHWEGLTYKYDHLFDRDINTYKRTLDKLQELKGSDKE